MPQEKIALLIRVLDLDAENAFLHTQPKGAFNPDMNVISG